MKSDVSGTELELRQEAGCKGTLAQGRKSSEVVWQQRRVIDTVNPCRKEGESGRDRWEELDVTQADLALETTKLWQVICHLENQSNRALVQKG